MGDMSGDMSGDVSGDILVVILVDGFVFATVSSVLCRVGF